MNKLANNVPFLVIALLTVDGLHFVFANALRAYVHPTTSVMYVLLIGTLQVGAYAFSQGKLKWSTFRQNTVFFITLGALVSVSTSINYAAVEFIDPGTASLLAETSILFGVALGVWWLRDKLTPQQIIGAAIAIVGVAIISFHPGDYLRIGALMVIASSALYAMHAAVVKRYGGEIDFLEFFVWRLIATTGLLIISAAVQNQITLPTDWRAWAIMLLTATVDICISRTLYYLSLRRLSVSIHSIILTLSPVVAILWSLALFGTQPTPRDLIGGVAVLAGIAIVTYRKTLPMTQLKWWQTAVFYQIYPRSFADANGDGIGDLPGIINRLDHLRDLGIDAIWLSPHYPSPQFDCGYDVADYMGVAPEYGTLDDFKHFLEGAHQRDLRVILDLVLNHTSHLHSWFLESRASRQSPKRDWYIWRDGRDGLPPNNWVSHFGGSAWELDPATGQYYYHFFFKEQPDLNWRNPEVRQAMFDAARFWLDLGVDGFRIDAIGTVFEHPDFPDHTSPLTLHEFQRRSREARTPAEHKDVHEQWLMLMKHQHDLPEVHDLMKEFRSLVDGYDDRVLVGETEDITYYGKGDDELHMVFNFRLMNSGRLTPDLVRANQRQQMAALPPGAWPCNTLGNHDTSRVLTHLGDGQHDPQLARLSLALMLTLRGTPFLYNGEEIGMSDYLLSDISQFRDFIGTWMYDSEIANGVAPAQAFEHAVRYGRDKCRTPMQWEAAPNGGFSPALVQPWLPVNPNWAEGVNVEAELNDPDSMLNFYRRLLAVRKRTPALINGDYAEVALPVEIANSVLAFTRSHATQTCLVALNFSSQAQPLNLPGAPTRLVFSSSQLKDSLTYTLILAPFEILICEL